MEDTKLAYGVGYLGEGTFKTCIGGEFLKSYMKWRGILNRCYNKINQEKQPTYKGCTVTTEWHNYQIFAKWFEENYIEGFELDKDILIKNNKVYSPETCCFVPKEINSMLTNRKSNKGKYPVGVNKRKCRFESRVNTKEERVYLGLFSTPEEAFQAYKIAKEKYIKEVADKWKFKILPEVYEALYNYKVEITD